MVMRLLECVAHGCRPGSFGASADKIKLSEVARRLAIMVLT